MAGRETGLPKTFTRVLGSALHLEFANVLPLLLGITATAVKHAQTLHQRSPIRCRVCVCVCVFVCVCVWGICSLEKLNVIGKILDLGDIFLFFCLTR